MPPTIRELKWTDFDDFVETYFHLYEERGYDGSIGIHLFNERPSLASEVAWFADLYRSVLEGTRIVRVAERDGRAVGHCSIGPLVRGPPSETSHVGLLGILVDHRHRGQGVGRALMEGALTAAKEKFRIVILEVFATNERAKALYAHLGFAPCGRVPGVYRRGSEFIARESMYLEMDQWTGSAPRPA